MNGVQRLQKKVISQCELFLVLTLIHTLCLIIFMYRTKVGHSDCVDQLDSCCHNKIHLEQF